MFCKQGTKTPIIVPILRAEGCKRRRVEGKVTSWNTINAAINDDYVKKKPYRIPKKNLTFACTIIEKVNKRKMKETFG